MLRVLFLIWCFLFSYFSTKIFGLDVTILNFKRFGLLARRFVRAQVVPQDRLYDQVEQSYRLLPLAIRCLDQAIVTWFCFNLYGYQAVLKIGVNIRPFESHAWVESGANKYITIATLADLEVMAEYDSW